MDGSRDEIREDTVRTIATRAELCAIAEPDDLFARYAVPAHLDGGWVLGGAVAFVRRSHSGRRNLATWGPREDLGRLLDPLIADGVLAVTLDHVSVEQQHADVLTERIGTADGSAWDWMATVVPPPPTDAEARVVPLDDLADAAELQDLADRENPLSEGYPGTGRSERWVGVRDDRGRIVACAAVHRLSSGAAHLSGIIVASSHRGQGLGRATTAVLTRDLLRTEPVVTLGMYADNVVARSLYHSMGYVTDKAWWSCSVLAPDGSGAGRESACT